MYCINICCILFIILGIKNLLSLSVNKVLFVSFTCSVGQSGVYSKNFFLTPFIVCSSLPGSTHDTLLAKNRKSPTRRSKSRWEPVSEEKPVEKQVSVDSVSAKYGGWLNYNDRSKKVFVIFFFLHSFFWFKIRCSLRVLVSLCLLFHSLIFLVVIWIRSLFYV